MLERPGYNTFFAGSNDSVVVDKSDITYDLIWQSDSVRLTNQSTVYGFGLHPATEAGAALIFSDGKIILWELVNTMVKCSHLFF
jgi:hypothetical protein